MDKHFLSHHFLVEWGGSRTDFESVTGLDFIREVVEIHQGTSPAQVPMKQPGLTKYNNVTLRRHVQKNDLEMYNWWNEQIVGVQFRNISIKLLNENHEPFITWNLLNAFPVRVSYTPLQAGVSQAIMEEMELAFERMVVVQN